MRHTDFGVAVTLVDGAVWSVQGRKVEGGDKNSRVSSQKVKVLLALGVPDVSTLSALNAAKGQSRSYSNIIVYVHRERVVVVTIVSVRNRGYLRRVLALEINDLLGGVLGLATSSGSSRGCDRCHCEYYRCGEECEMKIE